MNGNQRADAVRTTEGNTSMDAKSEHPLDSATSETPACLETSRAGTGRPHQRPTPKGAGRLEKAMNHKSDMNGGEESDDRVVPAKCPNKDGSPSSAEGAEGRRSAKENSGQTAASQTQSWGNASSGLHRAREARKKLLDRGWNFSTFAAHLIEQDLF
jgi:hypothetical protein